MSSNEIRRIDFLFDNLGNLKTLDLTSNRLSSLPSDIDGASTLEYLSLQYNQLTDLPVSIVNLSKLESLWLNGNYLNELPSSISNLSSLRSLGVQYNDISEIPSTINSLPYLEFLDFRVNRIGNLPDFSQHPNISTLELLVGYNRISLNDIAYNLIGLDTYNFEFFDYLPQDNLVLAAKTESIAEGETASIAGFADNHPQTNYQWQQQVSGEWGDIEGANDSSLTLVGVTAADTGLYRFLITNDWIEGEVQQGLTYHLVLDEYSPVWLEAECAAVGSNWKTVEDPAAAGGKYLTYPSGTSMNNAPTNPADHAVFSVDVTESGSYYLQARIRAPNLSSNSLWFKVDNGNWIKWWEGIATGPVFNWSLAPGAPFTLNPGTHTITVAYRESGTQLDKISLSTNPALPSGLGDADSNCTPASATYWLEAECASVGADWQVSNSASAAAGKFLSAPGKNSRDNPPTNAAAHLVLNLDVTEAGSYYLLARVQAPSDGGNSFWFRVDGGDWIEWWEGIVVGNTFAWNLAPGSALPLLAGSHTITVAYREGDTRLDKIALSTSDNLPDGLGEVAACGTGSSDPPALVWAEAECATVGSNWVTRESSSASGGQYLVYPSGGRASSPPTAAADQLKLIVEVTEARAYYLLGRINAPALASNSFWIRIDDQPWIEWWEGIATGSGFGWNVAPGGPVELSAGIHTITIAYREVGTQLDKLLLSTTDQAPEGVGESVTCEDPDDYTPPTPPSIVNNPPDGSTAPSVGGSRPGSQSNSNVNYVRSFTPREQYNQPSQVNLSQSVSNVSVSTEYLDGLGRPIQTVVRGGSGSASQDLVQPVEYDAFGRQTKQYLPYAASGASGAYRPNGVQNQYDFYADPPSDVARSGYAYAETKFEPSPLNRPVEQTAPGENWRLGSGHEVETKYLVNAAGEVRQWTAGNLTGTSLSTSKNYDAGTLYKTVITDENGHTTTEFRDKLDQVVLKRVQGPDSDLNTYYVYDDYNLLRFVIPPEASKQLVDNTSLANNADFRQKYLFVYQYDNRRRMGSKQVPGGGTTTMKYDQWDRLVLSQSALQASRGEWSFTKYDELNRPIITGVTTSSTVSGSRFETRNSSTVGYTLSGSPHSVSEGNVRTVTYYDDYGFPHAGGSYAFSDNLAARSFRPDARGQVTGNKTRNLSDNAWLNSVTYYDEQYRPIQAVSDNHLGGTDRITTTYRNAVNNEMTASKRVHSSNSGPTRTITQNYSYDHTGRLTQVTHQWDGQAAVTLSAQQYNAIGELVNKQLGNSQQAVDYRYNIRGWLTKINDLGSSDRYFNQELYYDFGFDKKQHNGNISGIRWNRAGGKAHAYGYLYDQVNRITGADYRAKPLSGSWATSPGNFSVDKVGYDQNGNITTLKRYGEQEERLYLWDNLEYKYDGNRLRAVGELPEGQAQVGFVDGVAGSATAEYNYDASGNMTLDANKGISEIKYDPVLNLPTEVVITGMGAIKYSYDASGTKLRQEVLPTDGSPTKTTDYVSGFHYTDGTLDFIQHEEGRLMIQDGLAYHYDLKDHLGNVRVMFSSVPVTMTVMATMEADAAPVEEAVFEGVAESRQTLAFHNTTDASSSEPQPNKVATLQPGEQGPAKSVAVHAGDTVRLKVNARYETVPSQVQGMEGVATEIAGAVSRSAAGLENAGAAIGSNGLAAGGALINGKEQEVPQAYLNYLLYDEDFKLIDQGFQQVSQAAAVGKANPSATPEELSLEVPIQEEGFLYTYLSNEPGAAASSSLVYFDDFTVEQQSYIVQVDDFYPFGGSFDQSAGRVLENKYLFNGKELQPEWGMYDFGARMYDPILGRWMSPDPLSDEFPSHSVYNYAVNNPIRFVDPDGQAPFDPNCPGCPPPSGSQLVHEGRQKFVDESINYFTGMIEGIKTVLGFTEANDVSVLATGRNIDGSQASGTDYMFAGAGVFLPVSGAAAKQGFRNFFEGISTIAAKSDAVQNAGKALNFTVDKGSIIFKNGDNKAGFYDFVITEGGELRIGNGHFALSDQGQTGVKGAGEIYVNESGKIGLINNNSGHYQPNQEQLKKQAVILRESGLTTDDFDVVDVSGQ